MVFAIHWHESATGIYVSPSWTPSHLPPHPMADWCQCMAGSSQCTSPEHPASCIEPGLAVCFTYGNIHASVLFSQIIQPSPSPRESQSLFFTSVSLFCCLTYRVIVTIFLNSIYICVSILYWCLSFWLTSLCIIGSNFIHLIRTDSNEFFLMAE